MLKLTVYIGLSKYYLLKRPIDIKIIKGVLILKREKGLFEELIKIDGIINDIINSSKNKRDRKDVQKYIGNYNGSEITNEIILTARKIRNLYLTDFTLTEPKIHTIVDGLSKKTRTISVPVYFPDQIITHGIIRAMYRVLTKGMYKYSCASIPDRGVHYAKNIIQKWLTTDKKNTKYFIKIDITKFFDSIDNRILFDMFDKRIKDNSFMKILSKFFHKANGIPIGYYSSQWFANYYLQYIDYFIKQYISMEQYVIDKSKNRKDIKSGAYYYIRYMDDIVIFGRNKKRLHNIVSRLIYELKYKLNLSVKSNYQVCRFIYENKEKTKGSFLDFVGFRFYRDHITIRKRIYKRIIKTFSGLVKNHNRSDLARSLLSYNGWLVHSNSYKLKSKMSLILPKDKLIELSKA